MGIERIGFFSALKGSFLKSEITGCKLVKTKKNVKMLHGSHLIQEKKRAGRHFSS